MTSPCWPLLTDWGSFAGSPICEEPATPQGIGLISGSLVVIVGRDLVTSRAEAEVDRSARQHHEGGDRGGGVEPEATAGDEVNAIVDGYLARAGATPIDSTREA